MLKYLFQCDIALGFKGLILWFCKVLGNYFSHSDC